MEYTELSLVNAGITQGSVLESLLYLPNSPGSTITFADNIAVLATDIDPVIAAQKLQTNLSAIQNWFRKWGIKTNTQIDPRHIHHMKRNMPPVHINNVQLPQEDVKYLGLQHNRRLTWHKQIFAKQKQPGITLTKMYWLLG
jgi:hypothetical protein